MPITTTKTLPVGAYGNLVFTVNEYEMSAECTTASLAITLPAGTWRVYARITCVPSAIFPATYDSGVFTGPGTVTVPAMYARTYKQLDAGAGSAFASCVVVQSNGHVTGRSWTSTVNENAVTIPAAPAARTSGIVWGAGSNWQVITGSGSSQTVSGNYVNVPSIFAQLAAAGVTTIRVPVWWPWLAPTGTQGGAVVWDTTIRGYFDTVLNAAASAGLTTLLTPTATTPAWAGRSGGTYGGYGNPPNNWTDYDAFLDAMLTRWGANAVAVAAGQNEANAYPGGVPNGGLTATYTNLTWTYADLVTAQIHTYDRVKAYNASMPVGTHGIAFGDAVHLAQLYATTGFGGKFDFVNIHPYTIRLDKAHSRTPGGFGLNKLPDRPWGDSNGDYFDLTSGCEAIYKVMSANGDSAKKVWVNEYGWTTNPSGTPAGEMSGYDATEETYATQIRIAMRQAARLPYLGGFFVWSAHDPGQYATSASGPDTSGPGQLNYYGLLDKLGTRQKPGYAQYKQTITDIAAGAA